MRIMPIDAFLGHEIEFNTWTGQRNRSASVHLLCSSLMSNFNTEVISILCNTVGVSIYYLCVFMMNIFCDPPQDFSHRNPASWNEHNHDENERRRKTGANGEHKKKISEERLREVTSTRQHKETKEVTDVQVKEAAGKSSNKWTETFHLAAAATAKKTTKTRW